MRKKHLYSFVFITETKYYEDIVDRIIEEDGVDLYEELAKLDNFTDIRFSKEALR
ncbi:hypothetical protein QYZ88_008120 [Lachnospiraceae bacterium C1.1]|nr:hypothetical protein [Lachnospiraceae bacterium C1.1]